MVADIEIPKTLCHYTTQTGLLGIIRDRVGWATSICYMNDAREFNYARELLYETFKTYKCDESEQFFEVLRFLRPPASWDVYPDIFVFALTEHDDRLGLWRAYGGGAAGYSIGFATSELKAEAEKEGFRLVKCVYNKEEQQRLIVDLIEQSRAWVNSLPNGFEIIRDFQPQHRFWTAFAMLAATIKHPSFEEEAEWRLVSDGMTIPRPMINKKDNKVSGYFHQPRKIKWRPGASPLTPFVELPLANNEGLLPIYRIRVGPSIDPLRTRHAADMLLHTSGQSAAKGVAASTIPFRTW
jgi:DUF2971 family protein